jgi:hypothetical protein
VGLSAGLDILGIKDFLPCHVLNPGLPRQWLVAVSTHNFCECTACCISCDDHIVCAVKRHIEETAKKIDWITFCIF